MSQQRKANYPVSILTRVNTLEPEEASMNTEARLNGSPALQPAKKRRKKSSKRSRSTKRSKTSARAASRNAQIGARASAFFDSWRPGATATARKKTWNELVDGLGAVAYQWKHKVEELRDTRDERISAIESVVQREINKNIEQGLQLLKRAQKIAAQQAKRRGFKKAATWINNAGKKVSSSR